MISTTRADSATFGEVPASYRKNTLYSMMYRQEKKKPNLKLRRNRENGLALLES